jgi:hypothetical protein
MIARIVPSQEGLIKQTAGHAWHQMAGRNNAKFGKMETEMLASTLRHFLKESEENYESFD